MVAATAMIICAAFRHLICRKSYRFTNGLWKMPVERYVVEPATIVTTLVTVVANWQYEPVEDVVSESVQRHKSEIEIQNIRRSDQDRPDQPG